SGCRQYRENIAEATEALAAESIQAPEIHLLRKFYNHPGFIEANVEHVQTALAQIPAECRSETQIVFTAHSIPLGMAQNSMYATHFSETSRLVAEGIGHARWQQAYQSRSGSPQQPWLEPDILDALRELKAEGVQEVVIAPVGFISDHMEVLYDLDTEARQLSDEIGLYMVRAATAGIHPAFVAMIRELMLERIEVELGGIPERPVLGNFPASHDVCPVNCCLPAQRPTSAQTAPTTTATHS
ncbi:MAG: ferrochelatase, partial [Burkholderiales bacterium]|nr:ferrochelatase [Anaerolineae bacterium]